MRTAARKLLQALWDAITVDTQESCFLGGVQYLPQDDAVRLVATELIAKRQKAYADGLGHANSLLLKRDSFSHEHEARLIYVDSAGTYPKDKLYRMPIDVNDLFEEVILDPRLVSLDVGDRETEFRSLGLTSPIRKSLLYQKVLHEIVLP